MHMKKKLISIIAPMYNEETLVNEYCEVTFNILNVLREKYCVEILLINDGSKDDTLRIMQAQQAKNPDMIGLISLSRNFGLEGAISAGLRKAAGDAVIVMDADLQDPPNLILKMVEAWENGADVVIGNRNERKYDGYFKRVSAGLFYKILNSFSGKIKMGNSAANYRLLDKKVVDLINSLPEVNSVFRISVPYIGMKTKTIDYEREKRHSGKTKYNYKTLVRYALDSITGISIEPLRKLFLLIPLSFLLTIAFLILGILADDYNAIFLIGSIIGLFFTILFICLSIMAEYIGQIMIETKRRPTSIIAEYSPSNASKERK